MMNKAAVSIIALLICSSAVGGEDVTIKAVMADLYFLSLRCDNYLSEITPEEKDLMSDAASKLEINQFLRFIASKDAIINDFQKPFKDVGLTFNPHMSELQKKLKGEPNLADVYTDENYSPEINTQALNTWVSIKKSNNRSKTQKEDINKFVFCRIATVAAGLGANANHSEKYAAYVVARPRKASIGYFEVSADRGTYGKEVGTGNRYAEPKSWDGSRFFTVHATFKNMDTESRLPVEGSLFINYGGREYEFDSVEPVALEGYNIWFRKINPLIAMKTKIVYRIPDEVYGEVFWRPGRNPDDKRLWIGNIKADASN